MEEDSSGEGSDEGQNSESQLSHFNRDTLQEAVRAIEKSFSRSYKARTKLLFSIQEYFEKIAHLLTENGEFYQRHVVNVLECFQDLIVETANLCVSLSHHVTRIHEIFDALYNMGAYIETIIIAVYTRCKRTGVVFGELMKEFLNSLIMISTKNPESWLYSVLISPIVVHMMNAFSYPDHENFRTAWCYEIGDLMFDVGKAVFTCGDFYCQHYLITIISCWAKWATPGRSLSVINSVFACVEANARKELLRSSDIVETASSIRIFLNALNLSPRGPKSVIPIFCMYLFVCDTEIRPPEHQICTNAEFWVDFSIESGRLHAFYSIPGAASLASLSIRRDQVDSVCLNWVINNGESQDSQEDSNTQSTFSKNEKVLFFHLLLSVDFDAVTSDIVSLLGKEYRSVYFVFRNGELVEKVLREMGYHIHECGTKNCERPRALRRLLTTEHRLSYKESWCPESQVFGLDKSLNDTHLSNLSQKSGRKDTDGGCVDALDVSVPEYGEINESFGHEINLLNLSGQENRFDNMADKTFGSVSNTSFRSNSTSLYVSVSSDPFSPLGDETTAENDILNTSTATNFEDPLPRGAREKYSHLYNHAPFHKFSPRKKDIPQTEFDIYESPTSTEIPGTNPDQRPQINLTSTPARKPFRKVRKATPKGPTTLPTTPDAEVSSRDGDGSQSECDIPEITPTNQAARATDQGSPINLASTPARKPFRKNRKPTPKPPTSSPPTTLDTQVNSKDTSIFESVPTTPQTRYAEDQCSLNNFTPTPTRKPFQKSRKSTPKPSTPQPTTPDTEVSSKDASIFESDSTTPQTRRAEDQCNVNDLVSTPARKPFRKNRKPTPKPPTSSPTTTPDTEVSSKDASIFESVPTTPQTRYAEDQCTVIDLASTPTRKPFRKIRKVTPTVSTPPSTTPDAEVDSRDGSQSESEVPEVIPTTPQTQCVDQSTLINLTSSPVRKPVRKSRKPTPKPSTLLHTTIDTDVDCDYTSQTEIEIPESGPTTPRTRCEEDQYPLINLVSTPAGKPIRKIRKVTSTASTPVSTTPDAQMNSDDDSRMEIEISESVPTTPLILSTEDQCSLNNFTPTPTPKSFQKIRKSTPKPSTPLLTTLDAEVDNKDASHTEIDISESVPTTPQTRSADQCPLINLTSTPSLTPLRKIRKVTPLPSTPDSEVDSRDGSQSEYDITEMFGLSLNTPRMATPKQNAKTNVVMTPRKKFKFVRTSSPKDVANFHEPITPPVSEIGSPQANILNWTLPTIAEGNESKSSLESESSRSSSPIFGFSRTLQPMDSQSAPNPKSLVLEKSPPPTDPPTRSTRNSVTAKLPCYASAHEEWTSRIAEKEQAPDFDPYDLLASSEMDEYRAKLFPKTKTYSAKKKPPLKTLRGIRIVKLKKPTKQRTVLAQKNDRLDDMNTEDFAFIPPPTTTTNRSRFFKTRQ